MKSSGTWLQATARYGVEQWDKREAIKWRHKWKWQSRQRNRHCSAGGHRKVQMHLLQSVTTESRAMELLKKTEGNPRLHFLSHSVTAKQSGRVCHDDALYRRSAPAPLSALAPDCAVQFGFTPRSLYPRYHCIGSWVSHRHAVEKKFPCRERNLGRPAVARPYIGWATPSPIRYPVSCSLQYLPPSTG